MNQSFFSSLKLNIKHLTPKRCRVACCAETTKDRLFYKGYTKLKSEVSVQSMIKTLRVVKAAVKRNFRRKEWEKFKKDHDRTKLHLTQLTQKSTFKRDALSDDDDDDD